MLVDLHCHSTCSDGVLTPGELVGRAVERGVTLLALTDHDETRGIAEARRRARSAGIDLVSGVEISVSWSGQTIHVLGLAVDPDHPALSAGLEGLRRGRRRRAEAIALELEKIGIAGSLEGACAYAANPDLVGRAHFARFLVERGHARDVNGVFRKYLASGKAGHVPHRWTQLGEAVDWICASGGTAVLAHPGRYGLSDVQRDTLFGEFRDAGGCGVEIVTGSHAPHHFELYARYARRFGLLASAGSDFHGPGESRFDLGGAPALPAGCTPVWTRF